METDQLNKPQEEWQEALQELELLKLKLNRVILMISPDESFASNPSETGGIR